MALMQYEAMYDCSCEDAECEVRISSKKGITNSPPPVCILGKNIAHVLENGSPQWKLKSQRFKNDRART
jgi:hypothetical protein